MKNSRCPSRYRSALLSAAADFGRHSSVSSASRRHRDGRHWSWSARRPSSGFRRPRNYSRSHNSWRSLRRDLFEHRSRQMFLPIHRPGSRTARTRLRRIYLTLAQRLICSHQAQRRRQTTTTIGRRLMRQPLATEMPSLFSPGRGSNSEEIATVSVSRMGQIIAIVGCK